MNSEQIIENLRKESESLWYQDEELKAKFKGWKEELQKLERE